MIGQTLSHYRISAALGAGGMGEVYRATDTKLGRDVAIKVLPSEVAEDPERLARFEREAQLLAALNHPNVGAIYGLEEAKGKPFLVLELVEGEELQQRLERGPIPVDEAFEIARQIAEGLGAAHDKGVVHRDLKPANVKVAADGAVKVLDFGLAKAWSDDPITGSSSDLSQSPTLAHTGTEAGVILGTAAYMSPEQARGKPTDKRADIWAFGAVLFEMLTGERLFEGETVSDVLAAVMRDDPDWTKLPASTPTAVRRLLRRCLEKAPRERLHDIADARLELDEPAPDVTGAEVGPSQAPNRRTVVLAAAAGLALFICGWLLRPTNDPRPQPVRRFDLGVTKVEADVGTAPTMSPDGTRILYRTDGRLWVQRLDQLEPQELEATRDKNPRFFFWSPDGTRIGFVSDVADFQLSTIAVATGEETVLANLPSDLDRSGGGVWSEDGRIVFCGSDTIGLIEVPETGGEPRSLLELEEEETDIHEISALPDGRGFLFTVHRATMPDAIALLAGGSRQPVLTLEGEVLRSPVYSASGHILYSQATTNPGIWAIPFSLARLKVTGDPFLVVPRGTLPSVSADGTLSYVRAGITPEALVWVDQSGHAEALAELEPGVSLLGIRFSPDGNRVLTSFGKDGNWDVWSYDLSRGAMTRLTFHDAYDALARWSDDGGRFVFTSQRDGRDYNIFSRGTGGNGGTDRLTEGKEYDRSQAVSPDGEWLLFQRRNPAGAHDLWRLQLNEESAPEPLIESPYDKANVSFSPDGSWIAYQSNESGRWEIYVQRFPDLVGKLQLSTQGGHTPRWAREGHEVFFWSEPGLMAVEMAVREGALRPTAPRLVFAPDEDSQLVGQTYDVAPDGRLLMVRRSSGTAVTVVLNWFEELKAMAQDGRSR